MLLRYVVNIKFSFFYYCEVNWNNYILSYFGYNGLFKCYKGMKLLVEWVWMVVLKLLYLGYSFCVLGVGFNIDVNLIDMDVYYWKIFYCVFVCRYYYNKMRKLVFIKILKIKVIFR